MSLTKIQQALVEQGILRKDGRRKMGLLEPGGDSSDSEVKLQFPVYSTPREQEERATMSESGNECTGGIRQALEKKRLENLRQVLELEEKVKEERKRRLGVREWGADSGMGTQAEGGRRALSPIHVTGTHVRGEGRRYE